MHSILSDKTCIRLLKCVYYGLNRNQTGYAYRKLHQDPLQPLNDLLLGRPVAQVLRILGRSLLVKDDLPELFGRGTDDGQLEMNFNC